MDKIKLIGVVITIACALAGAFLGIDIKKMVCDAPVAAEAGK